MLNASLWDVMSTGLSRCSEPNRNTAITYGPNDTRKVRYRFRAATAAFEEILGVHPA